MNTEQREEIEEAIQTVEESLQYGFPCFTADCMLPLAQFARQQLNLRVDGEKLWGLFKRNGINWISEEDYCSREGAIELESMVLECLTTTPEEKE